MKLRLISLLFVLIAALAVAQGAASPHKAIVSTTLDFLDLTGVKDFYPPGTEDQGYMTLEQYEQCLKTLADAGIRKLYLRVNVTGIMLFPSKEAGTYGIDGGHFSGYPELASRVTRTLEHFNPCTETIRIGHQLGMEVWAWENFYDDGAFGEFGYASDSAEKYGLFPLMDKFYRGHPEYFAWPKPDGSIPTVEECARINKAVAGRHVGKIVFTSDFDKEAPCRLGMENVLLLVSNDNLTYRVYDKPYGFATARKGKRNQVILSGLDIAETYVKLHCVDVPQDNDFTMGIAHDRGEGREVYDTAGKPLHTVWGYATKEINHDTVNPERHALWFGFGDAAAAWDYGPRAIGFAVGEPMHPQQINYTRGMAELLNPAVLEHKLKRFAEIAEYPFDGFAFSTRTHSLVVADPDKWGYGPEVRKRYMERCGKDIWAKDFTDYAGVQALRAEGMDALLAGCKKIAAGRPIYVHIPEMPPCLNPTAGEGAPYYWNSYGSFPFNWQKWIADGSVDGVVMINWKEFRPEYFAARRGKAKLTSFREIAHVYKMGPEAFEQELFERGYHPDVDELELYESCVYLVEPTLMEKVRNYINSTPPKTQSSAGQRDREMAMLKAHLTQPITRAYETGGAASRFTWVFLGDSITSGIIHTHGGRSFTELFRNRVVGEMGLSLDVVINAGFSGLDTKIMLERGLYESHVQYYHPDAVFFMMGMNDARGVNHLTRRQFKENVAAFVDRIRADNAVPILMTASGIEFYKTPGGRPLEEYFKDDRGALDYYQTYLTAYRQLPDFMEAIREVAREKDVILVDNWAHWQEEASDPAVLATWLGETIHPGARGHIEIAREIFKTLGISNDGGNTMAARSIVVPNARSDR